MFRVAASILLVVLPMFAMAQQNSADMNYFFQQVLGHNGHIDQSLHDQFWAQFNGQKKEDVDPYINWIKGSLLSTQEFEIELWKSTLISYNNRRVIKTKGLIQLEKNAPTIARKSIPWPPGTPQYVDMLSSYDASEKVSMEDAKRLLDAAAHHQPFVAVNGRTVILDVNMIKQVLSSVNASFVRLTELLDEHWSAGS